MRHILRDTSLFLVPLTLIALLVGTSAAASDTKLQTVTLTCSDGNNFTTKLGTEAVTELTDAVSAMTLFPAGDPPLSCSLVTTPLLQEMTSSLTALSLRSQAGRSASRRKPTSPTRKLASGNPTFDYNVGGGQVFHLPFGLPPCFVTFGISAHTPNNVPGGAKGTINLSVPSGCGGGGTGPNRLQVRVDCLHVIGNHADKSGTVTKVTGQFLLDGFTEGGPAFISDTDVSKQGAPFDTLGWSPTTNMPLLPCGRAMFEAEISNGNINVHDAP
jgi:hypothetical protein